MTLAATATKLGGSFYHYIHDRVSGASQMPSSPTSLRNEPKSSTSVPPGIHPNRTPDY